MEEDIYDISIKYYANSFSFYIYLPTA